MEFRRSGQRDDRRRRVLREEVIRESTPRSSRETGPRARDYSRAARRVSQPRVVDSIPKRAWQLWLLALLLLGAGIGCGWLEYYLTPLAQSSRIAAHFLPSSPGGVDQWLATCLLLLASFVAYQIWSMRRYKSNDYRGAYQIWLWISGLLLLASLEANAGFSIFLDHYLAVEFGWVRPTQFVTWSQVLLVGCGLLLLARLIFEHRRSQAALLTLLLAAVCFISHFAYQDAISLVHDFGIGPSPLKANLQAPLISLSLCGQAFVLVSLCSYARFVFLEAHGLLKQSEQRRSPRAVRRRARHIRLLRAKREKREALAAEAAAEAAQESQPEPEAERATSRRRRDDSEVPRSKLDRPQLRVASQSSSEEDEANDRRGRKKKQSGKASSESAPASRARQQEESSEDSDMPELGIAPGTQSDEEGLEHGRTAGMSKAERRRLRKLARRSERRAA